MKLKPFSLTIAIQEQVNKEDTLRWAESEIVMPPLPEYRKEKMKFTTASAYAFGRQIINVMRP